MAQVKHNFPRHEYHRINDVETHILVWGDVFEGAGSDVVVCVTGNPGLPDFYEEFGEKLHNTLGLPVCIIGHAGHEEVPDAGSNVLKRQEHRFNLKGQLDHKIEFINMIDKNRRLHLMGHSIGAWMLVEILNEHEEIRSRAASVQLLFPTLHMMASTTSGFVVNWVLRYAHSLLIALVALVFLLPIDVKVLLITLYLKLQSLPPHYIGRILKYINPRVLEKVLFLAYDEMDTVKTLNHEGIDKIKHIMNVIYSSRDGWVPPSQTEELARYEPALRRQCVTYNHAFVLKASSKVAYMVAQFIETKINSSGSL